MLSTLMKPAPLSLCPSQIPHAYTESWDGPCGFAARGQRWSARYMTVLLLSQSTLFGPKKLAMWFAKASTFAIISISELTRTSDHLPVCCWRHTWLLASAGLYWYSCSLDAHRWKRLSPAMLLQMPPPYWSRKWTFQTKATEVKCWRQQLLL